MVKRFEGAAVLNNHIAEVGTELYRWVGGNLAVDPDDEVNELFFANRGDLGQVAEADAYFGIAQCFADEVRRILFSEFVAKIEPELAVVVSSRECHIHRQSKPRRSVWGNHFARAATEAEGGVCGEPSRGCVFATSPRATNRNLRKG